MFYVSSSHCVECVYCVSLERKIRQRTVFVFLHFIIYLGSTKDRSHLSWNVSEISSRNEFLVRLFLSDKSAIIFFFKYLFFSSQVRVLYLLYLLYMYNHIIYIQSYIESAKYVARLRERS